MKLVSHFLPSILEVKENYSPVSRVLVSSRCGFHTLQGHRDINLCVIFSDTLVPAGAGLSFLRPSAVLSILHCTPSCSRKHSLRISSDLPVLQHFLCLLVLCSNVSFLWLSCISAVACK